jgi:FMN phosphatase YigB (HAD superfamily)
MKSALKKWMDYRLIEQSGFFDPAYYLLTYPDCRRADVDPLWHFIEHGWREGRNPSAKFDTAYYLRVNLDVKQVGVNPLVHYLQNGQWEGRLPHPYHIARLPVVPAAKKQPGAKKPSRLSGVRSQIYKAGKKIYWLIPLKFRRKLLDWSYQNIGFFFRGQPHYENWRNSHAYAQISAFSQHNLIDIQTVQPALEVVGNIAIHLHIFYPELVDEFAAYLKNMPFGYDLYVSVASDEALAACQRAFTGLPFCRNVTIRRVANRGRDIAPLFCTFGEDLARYAYILHLHSKKSLYNKGATEGWREYLCNNLLGSEDRIRRIFTLLQKDEPCGIVYPQNYVFLPPWANTWLANRALGAAWCARLGIADVPQGYFDYPASSMFWVRGDSLAPLFQASITLDDFPEEAGQTDGTLAHTLERLFVLCARKQGMPPGILADEENPSWSPWRFDHYTNRAYADMAQLPTLPNIQLIAFDIFDTLLCRPLLNPETVKRIVARRIGGEGELLYQEYRTIAEGQARQAKGQEAGIQDVGMDEIYARLAELTHLPAEQIAAFRQMEEDVERASLSPRPEAVRLFQDALASGKPVVCITDMFLPRQTIEAFLRQQAVTGWKEIFVSSEVGLRKDGAKLYEHVLTRYALKPEQFLMIGDNERSDVQIPTDMGAAVIHLLKPVEFARGLPRFSTLITHHERKNDIDSELTLGLVVRKNFSPIHYPAFDPISLIQVTPYHLGYSLVGPMLVSFSQWLIQKARQDGVDRLYFLSREGKPMKEVYACWSEGVADAPQAEYLVLSRRAAGLAAIATLDDILDIAKTTYFSNTIENFLYTRYGLRLSEERWGELANAVKIERASLVSVQHQQIEHLIPLLQAIETEIHARVQLERLALLRYLAEKGLNRDTRQGVVDVGYGGSVQGYMNTLLSRQVHGYYLMTDERAAKIAETHQVHLRGCFYENVKRSSNNTPLMYRESFTLEKLLSTNEPQVEYYEIDAAGTVHGCHREMFPAELACADIRNQLLEGAMDFAKDARRIRETMLPDFQPSCWTAQMLFDAFLVQKSPKENELLSKIVLDDHYCGRGLVS